MQHANKTRGTGPLGGAGMVGLWGASSLIESVQTGTITWTSGASNTATISAVDPSRSAVFLLGSTTLYSGSVPYECQAWVQITNATTVTASVYATSSYQRWVGYVVIQFAPGVIRRIQTGSITLTAATSNTATISEVNLNRSLLTNAGYYSTSYRYTSDYMGYFSMTNSTTVTLTRAVGDLNMYGYFQIVEFN